MKILKLRKKKAVKINIILLMFAIVALSGCISYPPRSDLKKYFLRIYDDGTEEFNIISVVENYDYLDFISVGENDSRVFSEFDYGLVRHDSFVRNISNFLISAEEHYNSSERYYYGELYYNIECANISSSRLTQVLQLTEQMQESQESQNLSLKDQYPISENFNLAVFVLENISTVQIISDEHSVDYSDSNFSNIIFSNLAWIVLIDIRYNWSGKAETCMGYEFTELILLTSDLEVIGFFSMAGGRIC